MVEKEKEKTQRENTPSRGICWVLLRGLFGSSPVVRGRHRFPSLAHLPFPFSPPSPLPPLSIPLVRKEEGHLSMVVGGGAGLARDCHSVMDDSTPTRSIRLPRACTCLGGETHPSCSFPSPCRESRRFRPI